MFKSMSVLSQAAAAAAAEQPMVAGSCALGLSIVIMYLTWLWKSKGMSALDQFPTLSSKGRAAVKALEEPAAAPAPTISAKKRAAKKAKKAKQAALEQSAEPKPVNPVTEVVTSIIEKVEQVVERSAVKEESVSTLAAVAALAVLADASTVLSAQLSAGRAEMNAPCVEEVHTATADINGAEWEGMPKLLDEAYMSFFGTMDVLKEDEEEKAQRRTTEYWASPFGGKNFALVEEAAPVVALYGSKSRLSCSATQSAGTSSAASVSWDPSSEADIIDTDSEGASEGCDRSLLDENDVFASKRDTAACEAMFDALLTRSTYVRPRVVA